MEYESTNAFGRFSKVVLTDEPVLKRKDMLKAKKATRKAAAKKAAKPATKKEAK